MRLPYLALIGTLSAGLAIPWAQGAKTDLDPTKTRIANTMDRAPEIDGEIDPAGEWSQAGFRGWEFRIDEAAEGDGIRGAELGSGEKPTDDSDLSVDVFAGLVGEDLYIGVIVVDDDISTDTAEAGSENGQTWQDDSVEIFIDGDNSNFPDRDTTGTNPAVVDTGGQFVITANNAYRHAEAGNPTFDPSSGWFAQTKETADGYHAEFRIPLRMIGNPQLGEHIGFTVGVNDDDGGGDAEGQLIWVGKTHEEITYGNLVIGHRRYEGLKAAPPTIDGKIGDDEYPSAEVVSITPFTGIYRVGDDSSDPENHRFDWRLSHDEDSIYIAARVWDDMIVADTAEANSEDGQTWVDDSVEIFFDSNESNLPGRDQDEVYDGQFVYTTNGAWRDNEANNPTFGADADWWAQSTVAEDGKSWDVEFVVKKATLVGGSTEDAPIGFNININDDDSGARGFQLNWDGSPHNENTYGELILVGCVPSDPGGCPEERSLNYGLLDQSEGSGTETLTIRNLGASQALTISNPQITGLTPEAFSIVGDFPTSIAAGESAEAVIAFDSGGMTGSYEATLTYETNDPDATESTLTAKLSASVLNLQGTIARWSLDDTDGEVMRDVSGWNRHGLYSGGATLGQEALLADGGTSVRFQGGSYGAVAGETFDSFIRFSVALYANLNDLSGFTTLFAKGIENGSPTFALLNLDGTLQWFTNDAPEFGTESAVLTAGQTHHIVATWDTERAAIYVDGVLVAEQASPQEVEILLENPFVIGSFFNNLNLDGRLDDVQFYNRALNSADAQWLFENTGCEIGQIGDGCGERPPIPIDLAAGAPGLAGFYWNIGPKETPTANEPMHRAGDGPEGADNSNSGWVDANVYTRPATGGFTASSFTYQGNDLTPIKEWLGADADSFTGTESDLDDGVFRMAGYLRVEAPGSRDFTLTSDDGSVLYIDDKLVISNDNGHGNATVTATVEFSQPGYYPVDIRYFNGDWTNAEGDHGGANFLGEAGLTDLVQTVDTIPPFYNHSVAEPVVPGTLPADSVADFGGPDVNNGWQYGYRNVDLANRTDDYDPVADFIEFPDDWWEGDFWNEPNADGDNVPWTEMRADSTHPNGDNNGELHWTIRRWNSPGGAAEITWSISKGNVNCGNGVTGAVHINGVRVDSATIAFDDAVGVTRTITADLQAGDVVDLVNSPFGDDGTDNDGCDGSNMAISFAPASDAPQLLVNLDASGLPEGALATWTNAGDLGGDFQAFGDPTVEVVDGILGVTLDGDGDYLEGPPSTPAIEGASPRSIIAWVYNPELQSEETVISWGKRGGPDGTNMSFNHGFHNNFGAVGHWGGDGPDIGWNPNFDVEADDPNSLGDAKQGEWTHIAYTQTGSFTKVYTNGQLTNSEDAALDTFAGLGILVGAQREADGVAVTEPLKGSLSIASVRVFAGVISDANILADSEMRPPTVDPPVGGLPYEQNFDAFADGVTDLGDGSIIASNDGTNSVLNGVLRMTQTGVNGTAASFILPGFDASAGWSAKFDFVVEHSGENTPADGFSFNYGAIPEGENFGNPAEEGYGDITPHVSYQVDTWLWNDAAAQDAGVGIELTGSELVLTKAADDDANFQPNERVSGTAYLSWDPANGASFTTTGLRTNADFSNIATAGFTPEAGYGFSFLARTGGHNETVEIDNLVVDELGSITPPVSSDIGAGLVAYYPLDGDSNDAVGNSHGVGKQWLPGGKGDNPDGLAAHPATTLTYAPGKYGNAVDLDGVDQYIETPVENEDIFDFGAPDAPTGFTVSAWFRVDGFTKGWQALIAKGEGAEWRVHRQGENDNFGPVGGATTPNNDIGEDSTSVNDGALHHVALVSDPNGIVGYYLDGVLLDSGDTPPVLDGNIMPMMIGQNPDTDNRTWDGLIDDVALWSRALSADEVSLIANSAVSVGELAGLQRPMIERPATIGSVVKAAGGSVSFGITAGTFDVEYSTDLQNWTVIATDVSGNFDDADAARNTAGAGYYRAVAK